VDDEARASRRRVRLLIAAYGVLACGTAGLVLLRPSGDRLADLHVYWGSAQQVLHGRPLYGFRAANGDPFTYPPFAVLLFLPLGLAPSNCVGHIRPTRHAAQRTRPANHQVRA
jgi:hypothetical protein